MPLIVFTILAQDGLANGLVYSLLAVSILLVFLVTRVLWVAAGDLVILSSFTLATATRGDVPGTVWITGLLALAVLIANAAKHLLHGKEDTRWGEHILAAAVSAVAVLAAIFLVPLNPPLIVNVLITLALMLPIAYALYRLAFQPTYSASPLMLLFVAVAIHYAFIGTTLLLFGPDGYRIPPYFPGRLSAFSVSISYQVLFIVFLTIVVILSLWLFFSRSILGKVLTATAVNRRGAQLVGISPMRGGVVAFVISGLMCTISGILIAPTTTLYYDSGFIISLKGFIGVVLGGMASFPLAAIGALGVGFVEAFSAFYTSTYRDVIVFGLLIPILLWRASMLGAHHDEDVH
ncbi:branched-chain amino acid ABC transporter permease [Amorphus sp. 3PC139-8]|uniref:branched-chain amino acid ABC transporter permease n=1 Tax=Amorphus sp. 3PC139-8 TaxID=2735676 RepID=UPI00345D735F